MKKKLIIVKLLQVQRIEEVCHLPQKVEPGWFATEIECLMSTWLIGQATAKHGCFLHT